MFEYTQTRYEPKLNIFDDDYHLPDQTIDNLSLMVQVKKIRRRYHNWFDYCDACQLYDEYMNEVIQNHGGKKNFKIAMLLGQVTEYIPNYPEFRKNRKNWVYKKYKVPRTVIDEDMDKHDVFDSYKVEKEELPKNYVKIDLVDADDVDQIFKGERKRKTVYDEDASDVVIRDLDALQGWYEAHRRKIETIERKGSKKKRKALKAKMSRQKLRIALNYRSLSDMIRIDDRRKKDHFYCKDMRPSQNTIGWYKGTMINVSDIDEINTIDKLKSIGVLTKNIKHGKTKVVRKKKKDKKKKKKYSAEDKFIKEYTSNQYHSFGEFENEMVNLTGIRRYS